MINYRALNSEFRNANSALPYRENNNQNISFIFIFFRNVDCVIASHTHTRARVHSCTYQCVCVRKRVEKHSSSSSSLARGVVVVVVGGGAGNGRRGGAWHKALRREPVRAYTHARTHKPKPSGCNYGDCCGNSICITRAYSNQLMASGVLRAPPMRRPCTRACRAAGRRGGRGWKGLDGAESWPSGILSYIRVCVCVCNILVYEYNIILYTRRGGGLPGGLGDPAGRCRRLRGPGRSTRADSQINIAPGHPPYPSPKPPPSGPE